MKNINKKKSKRTLRSLLVFAMSFVVLSSSVMSAYAYSSYAVIKVEHVFEDNNNAGGERDDLGGKREHVITQVENTDGDTSKDPTDNTNYAATEGSNQESNVDAELNAELKPATTPSLYLPEDSSGETEGSDGTDGSGESSSSGETGGSGEKDDLGESSDSEELTPEQIEQAKEEARKDLVEQIGAATENNHLKAEADNIYEKVEELLEGTDSEKNFWTDAMGSGDNLEFSKDNDSENKPYYYQVAISDESIAELKKAGYETTALRIIINVVGAFTNSGYADTTQDRIYVSVDGGKTWEPVNEAAKVKDFEPGVDYIHETVYSFLHVLKKSDNPTPTPTPSKAPTRSEEPTPSETPTPSTTPIPTSTPSATPTPTPGVDIPDEDVPLSVFIPSDEVEILDEEVPLAAVPLTADDTDIWYIIVALSACALMVLVFTGKRKEKA